MAARRSKDHLKASLKARSEQRAPAATPRLAYSCCIEHALAAGVQGDFVELGVWRGGASIYACAVLNVLGQHQRTVHLFDIFGLIEGYASATEFLDVNGSGMARG